MLGLRKPRNFNTKIIPFVKSHNAENCERGDPLRFFNTHSVAKFRKIEGGLFGVFKKISKKKTKNRNFNGSLIVPKNLEKGTLWDFLTFVLLQNIKQTEGWTLCKH